MIRASCFALLAAAAYATPSASLVDGRNFDAQLVEITPERTVLELPAGSWTVPTANVVSVELAGPDPEPSGRWNLYFHGGDRLRGMPRAAEGGLAIESDAVKGLRVTLAEVSAVRFGRLMGVAQTRYDEVFEELLRRGRDAVLVQRDTRPFPIDARVLEVREDSLSVHVGGAAREIEADKVYGFVLAREEEPAARDVPSVRVLLRDGGRITLPLERVDAAGVHGGGVSIAREAVARLDLLTGAYLPLEELEPIDVREVAAVGEAPRWRRGAMVHGGPLLLGGRAHPRGLGVHAYSRLEFVAGGRWASFSVRCGIDGAAGPDGEATFRVLGDGKVLAETVRRAGEGAAMLRADVSGVDRLVLEALPGTSYVSDFCDWVDARLYRAEPMDEPPGGS